MRACWPASRPNPSPAAGLPYDTVDGREIAGLVKSPQPGVPKTTPPWLIPSTMPPSTPGRTGCSASAGLFHLLAVDVDKGDPSMAAVEAALEAVVVMPSG